MENEREPLIPPAQQQPAFNYQAGYQNQNPQAVSSFGYVPVPTSQQQTSNVIVPGSQQPVVVVSRPNISFTGAIILSCFVAWCCGWICGLAAFIVALTGQSSNDDEATVRRYLRASYALSVAGIVTGIIIIIIVVSIIATAKCADAISCSSGYYVPVRGCKVCCPYASEDCYPCGNLC